MGGGSAVKRISREGYRKREENVNSGFLAGRLARISVGFQPGEGIDIGRKLVDLVAVVESQGLTDFQFSDIHDVPTVCLLIEVFLSRDSFLFPL